MTTTEWLAKANEHSDSLRSLISNYHPRLPNRPRHALKITAPGPEAVRQEIVKQMLLDGECQSDPVKRFDVALATGYVGELLSILDRAWFGVPESTSCWNIRGFSTAVDLLDDPPDAPEEMCESVSPNV